MLACGPDRTEVMSWSVMEQILDAADIIGPRVVEISGGAPELNPYIREFITALRKRGFKVRMRTNLTAMVEPGLDDIPAFLRSHEVKLSAGHSCFSGEAVCQQAGESVYEKGILALKRLNDVGYSVNPELQLNLLYNPGGASLPGGQSTHQAAYRRELYRHYNISFSRLWSITNVSPLRHGCETGIGGMDEQYAQLLQKAFNPRTLELLVCRHQLSISWDGSLFDCDTNMALGVVQSGDKPRLLADIDIDQLPGRRIKTGDHCFGCTATLDPNRFSHVLR